MSVWFPLGSERAAQPRQPLRLIDVSRNFPLLLIGDRNPAKEGKKREGKKKKRIKQCSVLV